MAANSAAYYGDPEHNAPGEIKNTPVAAAEEPDSTPEPAKQTTDAAPAEAVVEEPVVQPPAIPADPTRAPEKK